MEIVRRIGRCRELCRQYRQSGERLALVPTMGALHEGHLSLIRKAREVADRVAVSVFVNPLQFGPEEDFNSYPRSMTGDVEVCRRIGVDLFFHPETDEIYPAGFGTSIQVDRVTEGLCGATRPGHFRGVATVVTKLFHIVKPDVAVFGQKDAQQAVVIGRLIRDLNLAIEMVVGPIVRESDGLAVSSRNQFLSDEERAAAPVLHRALERAVERIGTGERSAARIGEAIREVLGKEDRAREDYVAIVDADDLRPIKTLAGRVLIALSAFLGRTRLIDNRIIEIEEKENNEK